MKPLLAVASCCLLVYSGPISRRRFGQNQRSIFGFLNSSEACAVSRTSCAGPQDVGGCTRPISCGSTFGITWNPPSWRLPTDTGGRWRWTQWKDARLPVAVETCTSAPAGNHSIDRSVQGALRSGPERGTAGARVFPETGPLRTLTQALATSCRNGPWSSTANLMILTASSRVAISTLTNQWEEILETLEDCRFRAPQRDSRPSTHSSQASLPPDRCHALVRRWSSGAVDGYKWPTRRNSRPKPGGSGTFLLAVPTLNEPLEVALLIAAKQAADEVDMIGTWSLGCPRRLGTSLPSPRNLMATEQVRDESPELQGDRVARREIEARIASLRSYIESELNQGLRLCHVWHTRGRQERAAYPGPTQ